MLLCEIATNKSIHPVPFSDLRKLIELRKRKIWRHLQKTLLCVYGDNSTCTTVDPAGIWKAQAGRRLFKCRVGIRPHLGCHHARNSMFAQVLSQGQHAIMNIFRVKMKQNGLHDALIDCSCETCHTAWYTNSIPHSPNLTSLCRPTDTPHTPLSIYLSLQHLTVLSESVLTIASSTRSSPPSSMRENAHRACIFR